MQKRLPAALCLLVLLAIARFCAAQETKEESVALTFAAAENLDLSNGHLRLRYHRTSGAPQPGGVGCYQL